MMKEKSEESSNILHLKKPYFLLSNFFEFLLTFQIFGNSNGI